MSLIQPFSPCWRLVPEKAAAMGQALLDQAEEIRTALADAPKLQDSEIWWQPELQEVWINEGDATDADHANKVKSALESMSFIAIVTRNDEARPPNHAAEGWVKIAMSPRTFGEILQFLPAQQLRGKIPSAPSPLAATLATGLLGAGLGYGAGWLGEKMLPREWERGRLRKTLATIGGLAGAVPGLAWGTVNAINGHGPTSSWPFEGGTPIDRPDWAVAAHQLATPDMQKASEEFRSHTSLLGGPDIPLNRFNDVVWNDPDVSSQLSPQMQAAATGIMTGAAHLAGDGQKAKLVSPLDVARFSLGMGSGYLSGALLGAFAGRVLGAPQETQDRFKQMGLFAGAINNLVPRIFGG